MTTTTQRPDAASLMDAYTEIEEGHRRARSLLAVLVRHFEALSKSAEDDFSIDAAYGLEEIARDTRDAIEAMRKGADRICDAHHIGDGGAR